MAADIKTFWGALLSVLLKCIAALGFATPDRAAARRQAVAADITVEAGARVAAQVTAQAREEGRAEAAAGAVPAPVGPPPSRRGPGARIPAPRAAESRLVRRSRGRTLPPTMKQRIGAEAHGASPSARSLRTDDGLDAIGDLGTLGAATVTGNAPAHKAGAGGTDRTAQVHRGAGPRRSADTVATRELFERAA